MRYVAAILLGFFGHLALASECLNKAQVEQVVLKKYKVEPSTSVELCDDTKISYHVLKALLFLNDLPISEESEKDDFNLHLLGKRPYDFFSQRAKSLFFNEDPDNSSCSRGTVAYAPYDESDPGKIIICPAAINETTLALSGILIHEARHLDGKQYHHRICAGGEFFGELACDDSYEQGGSYAVGTEYFVRVWRSKNVDLKIREQARAQAVTSFLERFNRKPFDLQEGALLVDHDGGASFYNGKVLKPVSLSLSKDVVPMVRQGVAVFFEPSQKRVAADFFGEKLQFPHPDVLNVEFALRMSDEEKTKVKDLVYGSEFACFMLEKTLKCIDHERQWFYKKIEHFKPERFLFSKKSSVIGAGQVYVSDSEGYIHFLPSSSQELRNIDTKEWGRTEKSYPQKYVSAFIRGYEIGLGLDGHISVYNLRQREWQAGEGVEGKTFRFIRAPYLWSEKLRQL